MKKIYVATYVTESGDRGALGYWEENPTEEQLTEIFKNYMPDEFVDYGEGECRYVWWEVHELNQRTLGEGIKTVEAL